MTHQLQADCQEPGSAPEPTLGNRVWATYTFLQQLVFLSHPVCMDACMTGEAAAVRQRVLSVQDVGQRPPRDIRTLDQDPAVNNLPRVAATTPHWTKTWVAALAVDNLPRVAAITPHWTKTCPGLAALRRRR